MASGPFKLQDSPDLGPLTSWDHLVPSQAHEKSKRRRSAQASSLRHVQQLASGQPSTLANGQRPLLPVVLTPGPAPQRKTRKKGLHSGHAAPMLPADSTKNISILLAKPTSQQLPPKQAGGKNWNTHSSPAPPDLRFRNREREALQLVLVARGSLV